jgi:hypothetical protein
VGREQHEIGREPGRDRARPILSIHQGDRAVSNAHRHDQRRPWMGSPELFEEALVQIVRRKRPEIMRLRIEHYSEG